MNYLLGPLLDYQFYLSPLSFCLPPYFETNFQLACEQILISRIGDRFFTVFVYFLHRTGSYSSCVKSSGVADANCFLRAKWWQHFLHSDVLFIIWELFCVTLGLLGSRFQYWIYRHSSTQDRGCLLHIFLRGSSEAMTRQNEKVFWKEISHHRI